MSQFPDQIVPPVAEIVAQFVLVLETPGQTRPDGLLGELLALHETNVAQWAAEDQARVEGSSDSAIAAAKRAIDSLNTRRHRCMESVDEGFHALIRPAPGAPPCTESPAMAIDRLSVLVVRVHYTELAARGPSEGAAVLRRRLPLLRTQLATLQRAIEVLLADVAAGARSFEPYRGHKLYGS